MLSKLGSSVRKFQGGFSQLPLPHRIGLGAGGLVAVFGALLLSDTFASIILPAALTVGGVIALLVLIQYLVMAMERKRNQALSGALAKDSQAASTLTEEERREALAEIRDQWGRALTELRNYGLNVYSMPWFMLVGEPASGKTTTLRNSGLEFPIGTEALSGFGGTRNCDWWFTNEAVILDTAGRFTFEERNAPDADQWAEFLRLLKRFRPRCPINGVLVAIPCTSLLQDSVEEQERKAKNIRDKLTQLEQTLEIQFPVFVVVTKCDLLLGFAEFFTRLPALEQRQLFGWSKPHPYDTPAPQDAWPSVFAGLRANLARWRNLFLSSDPESGDIDRLYAFPEELAAIEDPLSHYLKGIFVENRYLDPLFLRGVYFTSGLQKGRPIDKACAKLFHGAPGSASGAEPIFEKSTAFFIRDFYKKKLFPEKGLIQPTRLALRRTRILERVAYGAGGLVGLALLGTLIYQGYAQSQGVREPLTSLRSFDAAAGAWDRITPPPLDAALANAARIDAVLEGSLAKGLGSGSDLDTLKQDLTRAHVALLDRSVLGSFANHLRASFQRAPANWKEYELYRGAALGFFSLIELPSADRDSSAWPEEDRKHWDGILAWVRAGAPPELPLDRYQELIQSVLRFGADSGLARPDWRQTLTPSAADAGRIIDGLRGFLARTADGDPTLLDEKANENLASCGVWLRIHSLNNQLERDTIELQSAAVSSGSFAAANTALDSWVTRIAGPNGMIHAADELRELARQTETAPIVVHHSVINDLIKLSDTVFATLALLVRNDPEWARKPDEARDALRSHLGRKADEIRHRLTENPSPFAVTRPVESKPNSGRHTLSFDQEGFGSELGLFVVCHRAIADNVLVPLDPGQRADLHKLLADRLAKLTTERVFDKDQSARHATMSQALGGVLALARSVLLTRTLGDVRDHFADEARVSAFIDSITPATVAERLTYGQKVTNIPRRYRAPVACALLEWAGVFLGSTAGPATQPLCLDRSAEEAREMLLRVVEQYLSGYREAWDPVWRSFTPAISKPEGGWNEFYEEFGRGFGLASDGKALAKTFAELVRHLSEQIEPVAAVARDPNVDPELAEKIRDGIGRPFNWFLNAYGGVPAEGQPTLAATITAQYESFADVVNSLTRLREDNAEEFFKRIYAEEPGKGMNAERFTACESTILRGERKDALSVEPVTLGLLDVVKKARVILEREVETAFHAEWKKIAEEFAPRIAGKYPFAAGSDAARAPDVGREDFKNLHTRIDGLKRRWWSFLEPPSKNRIELRLRTPGVKVFCDLVLDWGKLIGFVEKGSLKLEEIKVHVNFRDDSIGEVRPYVAEERTRIEVELGSIDDREIHLGIEDQEPLDFAWDFARTPGIAFTLFQKTGDLDESTRWPGDDEHPSTWLALPRTLLEHAVEGWPQQDRREWLIWVEYELEERKYIMHHKFLLPEGRKLPEKPTLKLTDWQEP